MLSFPNCKINIGLQVLDKRADGFHNIETIFYPVAITDVLEIIPSEKFSFNSSGLPIPGDTYSNICIKAFHLVQKKFSVVPEVKIHLHKVIPMGAGLGGGSADGAFVLTMLNDLFNLGIKKNELIDLALQLGSDCPFFIINRPCYATGRGEVMEPINLDLTCYKLVVVHPGLHISTSYAFKNLQKNNIVKTDLKKAIQLPVQEWKNYVFNDFEQGAFGLYPSLENLKTKLYDAGALYASMTGSGSTFFGIFKKESDIRLDLPLAYRIYHI